MKHTLLFLTMQLNTLLCFFSLFLAFAHYSFFPSVVAASALALRLVFGRRAVQEEVVAGHGQRTYKDDELGEVHLTVIIAIQVIHHSLHRVFILSVLREDKNEKMELKLCIIVYKIHLHSMKNLKHPWNLSTALKILHSGKWFFTLE